jgi:hypothetical protein
VRPRDVETVIAPCGHLALFVGRETLTGPTVVGHRRIRLNSESESEHIANTHSATQTIGESESRTESYATMHATTHADTTASSVLDSLSTSEGTSQMQASGSGASAMSSEMLTPAIGLFDAPMVLGTSEALGSSIQSSEAFGSSSGVVRGDGSSRSQGSSVANTTATARGKSLSRGTHRAVSGGVAETRGASKTHGSAEALEPILEDRPSSVHSKDNVLYMAAQTLRNLPTGSAFLNYVGARGMTATLLVVPPVREYPLSNEAFAALRERFLSESAAAIPSAIAAAHVEARERAFLSFTAKRDDAPEPKTFRVAARSDAARRGSSGPVAAGRDVSGPETEPAAVIDRAPLTDGGQKRAKLAPRQGRRPAPSPPVIKTLDGGEPAPRMARRAVNGTKRALSKV